MSSIPVPPPRFTASPFSLCHFPPSFPFPPTALTPYDPSPDPAFYEQPRFVHHIDENAQASLAAYYEEALPKLEGKAARVLDLCSSWVSHISMRGNRPEVVGVGMNARELERNPLLAHWLVHDLNYNPRFASALGSSTKGMAFTDGSSPEGPFDAVICNVSIDYLYKPLEIMAEIGKVIKPGCWAHMAISNRCFPTKVVRPWLSLDEEQRLDLVANYFYHAGTSPPAAGHVAPSLAPMVKPGEIWEDIELVKVVESGRSDPLWVVRARRRGGEDVGDVE